MTFHLGVALDGYGWHTQAWELCDELPSVLSGRYWTDLAATAEQGLLDFLTIDDTLMPQPGRRERIDPKRLAGRGDAVLLAARIAPATRHIGLIPVATVTHTEPFHISKSIATLDFVSHGRAGWQPRVSVTSHEAALFGRRTIDPAELFDEARDYVEVVRRLWHSWEDDAVIRDVSAGRYLDVDKVHYIDFTGKFFSVKGPSITPRPPQGQPIVAVLAHALPVYEFASETADLVFVTPTDASIGEILNQVRGVSESLKIFADIVVTFHGQDDFRSDTWVWSGNAAELVDLLLGWQRLGIAGARLRPAVHAIDLPVIVDEVVPLLQRAGDFRDSYRDGETLRERLGITA
ncbi:LLM class flavin-dependent oxidoreductase [Mycobacterium vicinigordonae]|uniref:LLM class flavin-dependent oxidoreductase n=1 Tax=Mycobacterium vicinigordonae TaxID=1719132 RepID=A0A7D6DYU4_9MYCO|nr:LLM class flavin-dependent oxidoreductase [Mycobacterium vicinigordonae]QLL08087.1 LLM class flavin-dependent oxidoreductase [Mycobacterium vicinigordonae]